MYVIWNPEENTFLEYDSDFDRFISTDTIKEATRYTLEQALYRAGTLSGFRVIVPVVDDPNAEKYKRTLR